MSQGKIPLVEAGQCDSNDQDNKDDSDVDLVNNTDTAWITIDKSTCPRLYGCPRRILVGCQFLLIMAIMLCYTIYQLTLYFDKSYNRTESTTNVITDTFPLPYIYLNWDVYPGASNFSHIQYLKDLDQQYTNDSIQCSFGFFNSDKYQAIESVSGNISMSSLLSKNNWYNHLYTYDYMDGNRINIYGASGDLMIIPPDIDVDNVSINAASNMIIPGRGMEIIHTCTYLTDGKSGVSNATISATLNTLKSIMYFGYAIGHRDELNQYSSIDDAIWGVDNVNTGLFNQTKFIESGYVVDVTYLWYENINKIDENENSQWFVNGINGVFNATYLESKYAFDLHSSVYTLYSIYEPDMSGTKYIYKTQHRISWTDLISIIGGFYSSVAAVIAPIFIGLIWGFDLKFIRFQGIDDESPIRGVERKKMHTFLTHYYNDK